MINRRLHICYCEINLSRSYVNLRSETHRLIIKTIDFSRLREQIRPLCLFQNQDKALSNLPCKLKRFLFRIMSSCKLISQYIGSYRNKKNRKHLKGTRIQTCNCCSGVRNKKVEGTITATRIL